MNVLSPSLGGAGGADASASSRTTSGEKAGNGGFDALLQGKPTASKPAQSPAPKPTAGNADKPAGTQPDKPDPADETVESGSAGNSDGTTSEKKPDAPAGSDDAPWPPPGLAAMLGVPVDPAPAPAVSTPVDAKPAVSTPTLPAGNAAAPAVAAAAKPPTLPVAEEAGAEAAPVLQTLQANIKQAETPTDTDIPTPTAFSQLLHAQNVQEPRGTAAPGVIDAPTPTPDLNGGDFDEAIGARVGWLAEQKIGHAHIRITPHDLGQIDVKLQLDGERVHATFSSAHADVRHALESSLPRLREMLGEQGLQLAQADVGHQPASQQQGNGNEAGGTATGVAGTGGEPGVDIPAATSQTLRMRGLLDAYA